MYFGLLLVLVEGGGLVVAAADLAALDRPDGDDRLLERRAEEATGRQAKRWRWI